MNPTKNNCSTIAVLYLFLSIAITLLMAQTPFSKSAQAADYEGFGAATRGALDAPGGYETYHVTKLADDGSPGTLRDGVSQGSRYIVFDVGGTITLTNSLYIRKSYITIDGSSAPSPGITIIQPGTIGTFIYDNTGTISDIIIHHLRMDGQNAGGPNLNTGDIWGLDGDVPISNIILDHITAIGSTDGIFDITGDVNNVTVSWNFMKDTIFSTIVDYGSHNGISFHHNVFARNNERQVHLRGDQLMDYVNNVVYGWGWMENGDHGLDIHHDAGQINPSLNVENNVFHLVLGNWGDANNAIWFARGPDEGDVYFNGNILPVGENDAVSNSGRLPIPAYAEVTKYAASTLGDTVVPFAGTHYPTQEEQDLLNEISIAIGGQGGVDQPVWQPPIGIPAPSFGIEETYRMYDTVENRNGDLTYNESPGGGYYTHYIDNTDPNATNTSNPYGSVAVPRLSIPMPLPEGSVVEVHNSASQSSWRGIRIEGVGTVEKPIFVRGVNMPRVPLMLRVGQYGNAKYIIVEGISFFNGGILGRNDPEVFTTSYISVRNCDFYGDQDSGGFMITTWSSNTFNYIVFYNNTVHDNGIWDPDIAEGDRDIGGIGVGGGSYIWVIDNEMYHNEMDGIQIIGSNHVYVGRNTAHHNKQSGFWTKTAQDIIFSENTAYGHRASSSSPGQQMGSQYEPKRIWFLFNHIYDGNIGFLHGDLRTGEREEFYYIGNIIHDIYGTAAIRIWDHKDIYFVGNTMYNVSKGMSITPSTSSTETIVNNIFGTLSNPAGIHIDFRNIPSNAPVVSNNLFQDPMNVNVQSDNYIEADPLFVDEVARDFHLQPTSPAIDAGTSSGVVQQVFDRFEQLYGIDIRKDFQGGIRPHGEEWDIGAYEYGASSGEPDPEPEPEPKPEAEPDVNALQVGNNIIKTGGNQSAVIRCDMKEPGQLTVRIYDARGREVITLCDEQRGAGRHKFSWAGQDSGTHSVGSGIYIVHMKAGGYSKTNKIAVVK